MKIKTVTGVIIFEKEGSTIREAIIAAVAKGADLKGAYLGGVNLEGADLKGAYLEGANLEGAYLGGANLGGANLEGADLKGAEDLFQFGPMPTSGRICIAIWHETGWMVQAGCFWGNLEELEKKVRKTHNCPVYLGNIEILKRWNPNDSNDSNNATKG